MTKIIICRLHRVMMEEGNLFKMVRTLLLLQNFRALLCCSATVNLDGRW